MKYMGSFKPDNVSFIKGGWGLVWDGDSLSTCTGMIGRYLKYNASHKLSLYISAGVPVILWKESGLSEWITNNKLGIAINSLQELDVVLAEITMDEYEEIQRNVMEMSKKLREGGMLLSALS